MPSGFPVVFMDYRHAVAEEPYDTALETSVTNTDLSVHHMFAAEFDYGDIYGPVYMAFSDDCPDCVCPDPIPPIPPDADPPFPPVWPYPFVGGLLYGRDHLGMNINMIREDDYEFSNVVVGADGDPYNLADCTLILNAKWDVRDADANVVFTCTSDPADGIVIDSVTDGTFTVTIASAKTTPCPLHRVFLFYAIRMITADDEIKTILTGTLRVDPNVVDP